MTLMRDFYQEIIDIIGSGGEPCCVIPTGDPAFENAAHTTVTTKGQGALDGLVFTYSEARIDFDLPTIYIRNQFRTPVVSWNADNEEADTPDIDSWSRDDTAGEGFSTGMVLAPTKIAAFQDVLGKYDGAGTLREWIFGITSSDVSRGVLYDESANIQINRLASAPFTARIRELWIETYDGSGGSAAADGIDYYRNGLLHNGSATNNASYVGMENLSTVVTLAERSDGATQYGGQIILPFWTHRVLSAVEALNLNDIYVAMQRAQGSRVMRR